jgi:cytochrome c553
MKLRTVSRRSIFVGVGATLAAGILLGAAIVASGVYNVAASVEHFRVTNLVLEFALGRSVDFHSRDVVVPDGLDDPDMVRLGARHFASGCAICHEAPGGSRLPVTAGMYPPPPPLGDAAAKWEVGHLYWIVRHGLKFTGMPQWPGEARDDEVWPLVAFLNALPDMSPADYRQAANLQPAERPGQASVDCRSCHGDASRPPVSDLVPPLHGQSEAYLVRALAEYADDRRQSGMMEPIAAGLSSEAAATLARQFAAALRPPVRPYGEAVDPSSLARGEEIARRGLRERNVAACLSCHSGTRSPHYPRLEGLSETYIRQQLTLFRDGKRQASSHGRLMTAIAKRLKDEELADVAAFLASAEAYGGPADTSASR